MPRITISYRRDDTLDITGRIFDRLAAHFGRDAVFRDIDNIPAGADFRRYIDRALDQSDIILAIVGPHWVGQDPGPSRLANPTDFVRLEIETALRKEKPVIPVLVSRAVMPQPELLPPSLQDFSYRNAVRVDGGEDFEMHVSRLVRAMERTIAVNVEPAAREPVGPAAPVAVEATALSDPAPAEAAPHPEVSAAPRRLSEPVPTPNPDAQAPPSRRRRGWIVGLAAAVLLSLVGFGLWWLPGEMARREEIAAEKALTDERARQAAEKARQEEAARQAAAEKARQDEAARQAAAARAQQEEQGRLIAEANKQADAAYDRKDYTEAMRWYHQSADRGNIHAQARMGYIYDLGLGVAKDSAAAMNWYRKAADQGNAAAQFNIGLLYANGQGVPQDYNEALRWYRKAADQGHASAQSNLGALYANGQGVAQDYAEALRWYHKAADQGDAFGQNGLGLRYANGQGVPQDYVEAMRWYRKSAEQGNAFGQYNLGLLYAEGRGVPRDLAEAKKWMQKATDGGNADAKDWLAKH